MRFLLSCVAIIILAVCVYFFQFHQSNALPLQTGYNLYEQEDYLQAYEFFKQKAEHDPQAAFSLASMHLDEKVPNASKLEAEKWLIFAAKQDNKSALYNLGFLRFNGELEDTADDLDGLVSLNKAADLGATEAHLLLGGLYLKGSKKIAQDTELARRHFIQAVEESDDLFAKFGLAVITYQYDKDAVTAVNMAEKMLSDDFPAPALLLAQIYAEGAHGVEKNNALAKYYQGLARKRFFSMSSFLGPKLLSIYGVLNKQQKEQLLAYFEEMSTNKSNNYARYALFEYYNNGQLIFPNTEKALSYIAPLVAEKDPKALYLDYINSSKNSQNLIIAADANYPDAVYRLSQVYNNNYIDPSISYDTELANIYLRKAADANHKDALLDITKKLNVSGIDNPSLEKYTLSLLKNNANNSLALMRASEVYANKNLSIYSLEKSFELNKKAVSLNNHDYLKIELAKKYGFGIGTPQNLKKAIEIYNKLLPTAKEKHISISSLIELYFTYDITPYIDEHTIIKILEQEIADNNYINAGYYANYLLKQEPIKNKEKALTLYEAASKDSYSGQLAYAKALLELNERKDIAVRLLVELFTNTDLITGSELINSLSQKEQDQAYHLIFYVVNDDPEIKKILLKLAASANSNATAKELVNDLVGKDPDITFLYAIQKITEIKNIDIFPENELKEYYSFILNAAELGSTEAYEYIGQNLDNVTYISDIPYYKDKFKNLTGLTSNDAPNIYEKCIKLGSDACLLKLGEIYQKGYYGTPINYEKALYYYHQIKKQDSVFVRSNIRETKEQQQTLIKLKEGAKKLDPYSLYRLAHAYQEGKYGLPIDNNKALNYLKQSATMGYEDALEELIDYYSDESRIQQNKAAILTYYNKLADLGSQNYTRELAHQYLQGSSLVSADRAKAREYYIKAGNWGDEFIRYMDIVDLSLPVANESTLAKYELSNAYLHGRGVKRDVDKGLTYLELAAKAQHKWALRNYADILLNGFYSSAEKRWLIEPSNLETALTWMKQYPDSTYFAEDIQRYESLLTLDQSNTAQLYFELGNTQKRNTNLTQYWYQKSIQAGNYSAIQALATIANESVNMQPYYQLGAENNDLYSHIQLALQALNDSDTSTVTTNYNNAIQHLEKGLASPNKELSEIALKELAQLYQQGVKNAQKVILVTPDNNKLLALLTEQAEHHPDALISLFNYYYKHDPEKAFAYLQQAAKQGYTPAEQLLVEYRLQSNYCNNVNANRSQADLFLTQLVAKNDPNLNTAWYAQKMANNYMLDGCGLKPDYAKAVQWYKTYLELSSEYSVQQLPQALLKVGDIKQAYYYALLNESYPLTEEIKASLNEEEQAQVHKQIAEHKEYLAAGQYAKSIAEEVKRAEAGDGATAFSLAVDYARGDRVPQSDEKKLYYYELAGKNGYIRGYNVLGNMYLRKGPKQDAKKALYYFDLGAKANDSDTAHLAGDILYFGQAGIEKDYNAAAKYYDITDLEQGFHHAAAKYKIAYMYYNGLISNQSATDLQKAYDYLQIAYKYGDKNAKNAVKNWEFSAIGK